MFVLWSIFKSKNMSDLIRFLIIILLELSFGKTNGVLSDLLSNILNESHYDYRLRPFADKGHPLDISITMNVNEISHISEIQMEYALTCFIRQEWMDPRLAYTNYSKSITLNFNQFDRLWTPDLFIRNLKSGFLHTITEPNRLLRIHPDGRVLYSQRLSMTLTCDMVLHKYPMDNQTCFVELGSYAYTTDDLNFIWKADTDEPVELNSEISLAEYEITDVTYVKCIKLYQSTGSFPCLKVNFHLDRRLKAYMLSTYFPSLLVVFLSWLSFWIDADSTPARTSLSILTVLTVTTQSSSLARTTPTNSFTKASDIWMATCLVFVFAAFIEYSVVNTLARRQKNRLQNNPTTAKYSGFDSKKNPKRQRSPSVLKLQGIPTPTITSDHNVNPKDPLSHEVITQNSLDTSIKHGCHKIGWIHYFKDSYENNPAMLVENIARVVFPLLFITFNLFYWPMYLSGHTHKG